MKQTSGSQGLADGWWSSLTCNYFSQGNSQELCNMLHNKHLREMIQEIDSSEDPGKLLTQAMQIPIFTEFVHECLRIVEPQDENKMEVWTPMIQWSLCLFWWCSLVYAVWHKNSCTSDTRLQLLNQLNSFENLVLTTARLDELTLQLDLPALEK